MFTSLELGRDEKELNQGGLSLKKNPLLVSIIDGCETLKALIEKQQLKPEDIASAKALIILRTDKVRRAGGQTPVSRRGVLLHLLLAGAQFAHILPLYPATPLEQIGFAISVTQGYGLIVMRQPNSPSGW